MIATNTICHHPQIILFYYFSYSFTYQQFRLFVHPNTLRIWSQSTISLLPYFMVYHPLRSPTIMRCRSNMPCLFFFLFKNMGKFFLPHKSLFSCHSHIIYQRVSTLYIIIQTTQLPPSLCRTQPQG